MCLINPLKYITEVNELPFPGRVDKTFRKTDYPVEMAGLFIQTVHQEKISQLAYHQKGLSDHLFLDNVDLLFLL